MKELNLADHCKEDFLNAHERHWNDAELLMSHGRCANADQLYGLSAECGLKAVLVATSQELALEKKYYIHIDKLWGKFLSAQGRLPAKYMSLLSQENPYADWNICQRYVHEGEVDTAATKRHRQGAVWYGPLSKRRRRTVYSCDDEESFF